LDSKLIRQFGRYFLVGISSAAIELLLFIGLERLAHQDIRFCNVIAITIATTYNFFMSRSYTFKSLDNPTRSAFLYLLLFIFNQSFSTYTIVFLVKLGLASGYAKLATMCCIVLWNFVLYRKVVFKSTEQANEKNKAV
jgi:putative flippase GtrA